MLEAEILMLARRRDHTWCMSAREEFQMEQTQFTTGEQERQEDQLVDPSLGNTHEKKNKRKKEGDDDDNNEDLDLFKILIRPPISTCQVLLLPRFF